MGNYEKDYKITGTYASLLSFVGWIILLGGIFSLGLYLYIYITGEMPGFLIEFGIGFSNTDILFGELLITGFGAIGSGLLFIIIGQILRAIVDNTNANKEALSVLKAIQKSPVMNKKENKSSVKSSVKGKYVRDGIEFRSKEDLEAYFDAQNKS